MKSIDAIRIRLKELMKEKGTNYNDLANKSGITPSTLKTIFYYKPTKSTTIYTLSLLCGGLGITLREFFNSELFDDIYDLG